MSATAITNRRVPSRSSAGNQVPLILRASDSGEADAVCVSPDEAFRVLGVGRTAGYKSISEGTFPVEVVRIGRIIRVPLIPLRRALGIDSGADTTHDREPLL